MLQAGIGSITSAIGHDVLPSMLMAAITSATNTSHCSRSLKPWFMTVIDLIFNAQTDTPRHRQRQLKHATAENPLSSNETSAARPATNDAVGRFGSISATDNIFHPSRRQRSVTRNVSICIATAVLLKMSPCLLTKVQPPSVTTSSDFTRHHLKAFATGMIGTVA
jgi:hypothetical protein